MEPAAHPSRTALPGVGARYDLTTGAGRHLSVVVHNDGRRFLALHDPGDDDSCQATVPLSAAESEALARVLASEPRSPLAELGIDLDLVTEQIQVTPRSPYSGRTLGDTRARTRTGASIVAVLRRTAAVPSPTPDFRFASGDVLVVVGTREGVDALAEIIAEG